MNPESTMRVAFFSTKPYDRTFFGAANVSHELVFFEPRLTPETAPLANGFAAVCAFVNDQLNEAVLQQLADGGVRLIALRAAGFNNVDLPAAARLRLTIMRVPAYSPYAVAEHTFAMILALNRKIYRAHDRVRDGNLALDGLLGFDLHGSTLGIIGTGKIGAIVAQIAHGFGCRLLAYDTYQNPDCLQLGVQYVSKKDLFAQADILTLHCPLTPQTYHLIDEHALRQMKNGIMLINTSRGALIDTLAVIEALKSGRVGYLGIDVYEEEEELFFEDMSNRVITDDVFARLLTFPNVLVTGHQGFFTQTALRNIAETTLQNITDFEQGKDSPNVVKMGA